MSDRGVAMACLRQNDKVACKGRGFPYRFGARHAWAKVIRPGARVFLRYVIGKAKFEQFGFSVLVPITICATTSISGTILLPLHMMKGDVMFVVDNTTRVFVT